MRSEGAIDFPAEFIAAVLALTVTAFLTLAFFLFNQPLVDLESQLVRPATTAQGN